MDAQVTIDVWRPLLGLREPLPTALNLAREAFMEHVRPVLRSYDLSEQQWRKADGRRVKITLTNSGGKFCNQLGPEMERNHAETVALLDGVNLNALQRELAKFTEILEASLKSD